MSSIKGISGSGTEETQETKRVRGGRAPPPWKGSASGKPSEEFGVLFERLLDENLEILREMR